MIRSTADSPITRYFAVAMHALCVFVVPAAHLWDAAACGCGQPHAAAADPVCGHGHCCHHGHGDHSHGHGSHEPRETESPEGHDAPVSLAHDPDDDVWPPDPAKETGDG